jgi:hypothetical protein
LEAEIIDKGLATKDEAEFRPVDPSAAAALVAMLKFRRYLFTPEMPQDPRVEHLQRLHRRRRSRAVGHSRDAGQLLLAFLLLSIILGALVTVPGYGVVPAWVHHLTHSLHEDRVGMLPPPDGR